jgi:hypothetical protein
MWVLVARALVGQREPLVYTEPMLFVDNDQAKPMELHVFLKQGMRTYYQACFAAGQLM